jgi:hypothetical protein
MDLEHTRARFMAALKGLAEGKTVGDTVAVPPYGTSTKIFTALDHAAKYLDEAFAADDLAMLDDAFKVLGLSRTGDKKNAAAIAILNALIPARAKPRTP